MIEIRNRRIVVDGLPAMIMAGEVHYFRVGRAEWADRLDKLVEIGCGCVASYIPWLFHERPDGTFDLTGQTRPERDLGAFIDLCAERGLTFFARPGPFIMAELKNEGLPYRFYAEHPEIVPVGWDGRPAPTSTVDYLAPAFLDEADRWYAAVLPVLSTRTCAVGGPVIAVQLDNEIGMLAWVSNSPDLTDGLLDDLLDWCRNRYGDGLSRPLPPRLDRLARAVRTPDESWAAPLRVDLGWFMRDRFARYVSTLADSARRHGLRDTPFMINIHGTEGGDGVPFAIGVSQLFAAYRGIAGLVAGSDHYLGDLSMSVIADLHFINAAMYAVNGPDQPLTSLEFEAGTGDYSGHSDALYDPSTVDLKTRLCLAQGNRLINYYLLTGGVNPHLDVPVADGNDRISFTGERHGTAAPIGPLGQRGLTFAATAAVTHAATANGRWLADLDEEYDEVTAGFWPDAFMTEYHHPASAVMTEIVDDLMAHRGPGQGKSLWRSLLLAGVRFTASNLQNPDGKLPHTVALSTGLVLDPTVQHRLKRHLLEGGSLLLVGRLPQRDTENRPCTVLADALGLRPGELVRGTDRHYPSLVGHGLASWLPETRVGWLAALAPSTDDERLFTDVDGRTCAVTTRVGAGRAIVATVELPTHPELVRTMLEHLGSPPGLRLRTTVPGVVVTTGRSPRGERMLHLLNPTGYASIVDVDVDDRTGLLNQPLLLPARTGRMLGLGLRLPGGGEIVSSNAEITAVDLDQLRFSPGLQNGTEVWLRTDRAVTNPRTRTEGNLTVVTAPPGEDLLVTFAL